MSAPSGDIPNEFSRILTLEPHRDHPIAFTIDASPSECAALARRFGLPRLDALASRGELRPRIGSGWKLEAMLEAKLMQSCVISLEAFPVTVAEKFELDFNPLVSPDDEGEVDVTQSEAEPFPRDGRLDIGEVVAQQLSLALDPFARAPGVVWEGTTDGDASRPSPFAGLAGHLGTAKDP